MIASIGNKPIAVSLVKISPSQPSNTALATSVVSALVGLFLYYIVSNN